MKNKKIFAIMSSLLLLVMVLGFSGSASANDREKNEDKSFKNENSTIVKNDDTNTEVHLYNAGKVLVRGAKVTAVSGTTISATTSLASASLAWTVDASTAEFVRKHGGKSSLSEVTVGDMLSFSGSLSVGSTSIFNIKADVIKNWTPKAVVQKTTVEGKIKTIIDTTAPGTLVVTVGSQDYTVKLATDTSILNSLWLKTVLTNFHVGDKVRVYGTINADFTINATVVRNTSI